MDKVISRIIYSGEPHIRSVFYQKTPTSVNKKSLLSNVFFISIGQPNPEFCFGKY